MEGVVSMSSPTLGLRKSWEGGPIARIAEKKGTRVNLRRVAVRGGKKARFLYRIKQHRFNARSIKTTSF